MLLLSGDQSVVAEAREWVDGIDTVVTKTAHGRWSAEVLPPVVVQARIREAADTALRRFKRGEAPAPLRMEASVAAPLVIRIEFVGSDMGDKAALLPGIRRLDGRTLEYSALDMPAAYSAMRAAVTLALRA